MLESTVKKIGVDVKDLPLFKGYVTYYAIRWFCFAYWKHLVMSYKNMKYGNIGQTLLSPLTLFVDVWKLTNIHVLETLKHALAAYEMLTDM